MQEFFFYTRLGFTHVMDPSAVDHILFLSALAIPYAFRDWKRVLLLATLFTLAHCLSLALSVYGIMQVDSGWIEFLIPITILLTALYNIFYSGREEREKGIAVQGLATVFFGLVHGFGFSNYFNMLMAESEEKALPLLGFASGIEISQLLVILSVLLASQLLLRLGLKKKLFVLLFSAIIALLTIPMLIETFP